MQHVVDVLHRFVFGVYFPEGVAHDAQVAPEFRDQRHYFVRVAQYLDALGVRVVTQAERFFNAVGELSANRIVVGVVDTGQFSRTSSHPSLPLHPPHLGDLVFKFKKKSIQI